MSKKNLAIFSAFVLVIVIAWLIFQYLGYAIPVGQLRDGTSNELQSQIKVYLASDVFSKKESPTSGISWQCTDTIYGFDDRYAYTRVSCSGVYPEGVPTAFSGPMRFTYMQPGFIIQNFDMAKDGSEYVASLRKLFPKKMYDLVMSR